MPAQKRTPRRFPAALLLAVAFTLAVGVGAGLLAERFVDSETLVYLVKARLAREGPPVDVMVLGASQVVSSVRPDIIERDLPPG